jgi:hypothetical protein
LLVNSDVDLASDASFRAAMLARVPFPFALDLDAPSPWSLEPVAFPWLDVDQQVWRAV